MGEDAEADTMKCVNVRMVSEEHAVNMVSYVLVMRCQYGMCAVILLSMFKPKT